MPSIKNNADPLSSKLVLVVEDDKFFRDIVLMHLQELGFQMLVAVNGQEALDIANSHAIDLIISDIQMPISSGIDLLKEIRGLNPAFPPFVFTTSFSDISSEEALALGAEAFLRKPLGKRELIELVEKILVPKEERWLLETVHQESARPLNFTDRPVLGLLETDALPKVEIGQGGMFLALPHEFPASFEILRFRVDSGDSALGLLEGYGQVRWVRQEADESLRKGIGLEFLQLEEKTRERLLHYLTLHKPRAYIPIGKQRVV